MKKSLKILFLIIGIIILTLIVMATLKICPPNGPWPSPPWCSNKNIDSNFHYSKPDYIKEINIEIQNKNFIFGIGMMDLWGKICTSPFLCDNPIEDAKTTFTRLNQLNTNLVMITDFYQIDKDKNILEVEKGGARTISKEDMKILIDEAHQKNMEFMLITNLYEKNNSRKFLNFKNPTKEEIDKLFSQWKKTILKQAKKGKYDYFIINPRDIGFFFETKEDNDYINKKFIEIIPEIKKEYSGKICLWGFTTSITNFENYYDCLIIDQEVNKILSQTPEEIEKITKKWDDYFEKINYNKQTFILLMMPSYEGAMKNGWIEPVGIDYQDKYKKDYKEQALVYEGFFRAIAKHPKIDGMISYGYWWNDKLYPNTLEIFRNDLSHSIRDKDAESIFYKWSN